MDDRAVDWAGAQLVRTERTQPELSAEPKQPAQHAIGPAPITALQPTSTFLPSTLSLYCRTPYSPPLLPPPSLVLGRLRVVMLPRVQPSHLHISCHLVREAATTAPTNPRSLPKIQQYPPDHRRRLSLPACPIGHGSCIVTHVSDVSTL